MLKPFVRYHREKVRARLLQYIDDFLVAPSRLGRTATKRDIANADKMINRILTRLGLSRDVEKGDWIGGALVDYLGMRIDTQAMRFFITNKNVKRVRELESSLLLLSQRNRRLVLTDALRRFHGVTVSLTL